MAEDDQKCLKKLQTWREEVNWEIKEERLNFLDQFYSLIENWDGQLPNLRDIFRTEEIGWLLTRDVENVCKSEMTFSTSLLLDFIIQCGYKDQPKVDENGSPLLRRTTPIHNVARHEYSLLLHYITRDLFKVYDRFDVNYSDESGLTHFHVACKFACYDAVKKFLEFGQDPNCLPQTSVDPPMHLAVAEGHKKIVRLLLGSGADPNLADDEGSTSLHIMCNNSRDVLMEVWRKITELLLKRGADPNSADAEGSTPMHIMCKVCKDHDEDDGEDDRTDERELEELFFKRVVELMLKNGADANLADAKGLTPLHILCEENPSCCDNGNMLKIFFELNKHQKLQVDAYDKMGNTPLHCAVGSGEGKLVELLLSNGADPNLADAEGLTPLHIISKGDKDYYCDGDRDLLKIFFEINYEKHQQVQVNAVDQKGNSPLHLASKNYNRKAIELLLEHGANPNLADAEGLTPLHIICQSYYNEKRHFEKIFFAICDKMHQTVRVDARDKLGRTPLHLALHLGYKKTAETLLRRGANQNLADAKGLTPLHMICKRVYHEDYIEDDDDDDDDDNNLAKLFFQINDEIQQTVQVNARDMLGKAPLHYALGVGARSVVKLLLRRRADPNLADAEGLTPLHVICKRNDDEDDDDYDDDYDDDDEDDDGDDDDDDDDDDNLVKLFFQINDEIQQTVQVNARDMLGNAPLHYALGVGDRSVVKLLLRRGADQNLANEDGSTPLHIICQSKNANRLAEIFFKINDDIQETIQVDARDKFGRTPLQWAVAKLKAHCFKCLLDRGADVSSFDFPTENYFAENYRPRRGVGSAVYNTMFILKSLEERGFDLDQNIALMIMKFFAKHGLITDESIDVDEFLRRDKYFAREAKGHMMTPILSFYDFLHLPYEEAEKIFTLKDYEKLTSEILNHYDESHKKFILFLCEILTTRFFQRWTLEFFMTLTRYQLPILCCDIIIQEMRLKDMWCICLAAANQNLN